MLRPNIVVRNMIAVAAKHSTATTMLTTSHTSMLNGPSENALNAMSGGWYRRGVDDTPMRHAACDMISMANDVSSSVNALAARTLRKATNSIVIDSSTAARIATGMVANHEMSLVRMA